MRPTKTAVFPSTLLVSALLVSMSASTMAAERLCDSYSVQLFATSVQSKAKGMKANLIQNDFRGMVSTAKNYGKTLYRLRVGPYADEATAKLIKKSLETENIGYPSPKSNVVVKDKTLCRQLVVRATGVKLSLSEAVLQPLCRVV